MTQNVLSREDTKKTHATYIELQQRERRINGLIKEKKKKRHSKIKKKTVLLQQINDFQHKVVSVHRLVKQDSLS